MSEKKPRKKTEPKPKVNTLDWRNCPYERWNTRTVTQYFVEMNAEQFGVETYLPFRNWSVEQGMVKRALTVHGAEILHAAFDECFRSYRPTREYPILTAGFCVSYRINSVIPVLLTEKEAAAKEREALANVDYGEMKAWL